MRCQQYRQLFLWHTRLYFIVGRFPSVTLRVFLRSVSELGKLGQEFKVPARCMKALIVVLIGLGH